ncbi:MAG: porin [Burkholderiales bacterium]|nr:porin [Burkholderiales bacterium]
MKKSLLALAVLGAFAGAASAQSSVTIYGSLDLAVQKGNGGTAANNGALGTSKAWQERQSNASRLGFRGNEDLGGGLSAQFQIEHRFTPDDGAAATNAPFWQGRSYVQLSSATLGRVYLGREYTPAFWVQNKSDPFGNDGVAQFGASFSWAGFATPSTVVTNSATTSNTRASNTVGYKSPNLSGLTVNAAVGLGEAAVARDTGFNVEYAAGPIYAAMAYEKLNGGSAEDGNSLINLALHYDLGMVKPMLYYARAKLNVGTATPTTNKMLMIGALAPIGSGKLKVAYGRETIGAVAPDTKGNISKFGLGYDYPLSKRTNVYADVGFGRQGDDVTAGVVKSYTNNTAYAVGLKHTF